MRLKPRQEEISAPLSPVRRHRRAAVSRLLWRVTYKTTLLLAAGLALAFAFSTLGCTALKDQMIAPRDNDRLGRQVAEQIYADGLSNQADISLQARAGVIILSGRVLTDVQARQVAESAVRVAGVMRVENRLRVDEVSEDGDKHRRTLIEDVREALEHGVPRRGPRLLVEAEAGIVYLSGIVPDGRTRASAVIVAMNVPGVHGVEDNLMSEKP